MAGARRFPRNSENFFVQGEGVGSTMETEESKHAEHQASQLSFDSALGAIDGSVCWSAKIRRRMRVVRLGIFAGMLFSRRRNSGLTRVQAYVRPILAWGRGRVGRVRVEVV
jgi:hypothetical protein